MAFVAATVCVGVAALVRLPLDAWAGAPLPPYITFSPAIVVAGFVGGIRAGLFACALSITIAWWSFVWPYGSFALQTTRDALSIGVYVVTGSLMALVSGFARLLLHRLRASEQAGALAARESVHRIKNLITVTQALAKQALRRTQSLDEFGHAFDERLAALSRAQSVLITAASDAVDLGTLIDSALEPFSDSAALQITRGPQTFISASLASGLTLALYELGTNALKYGALHCPDGRIEVFWTCEERQCALHWQESRSSKADPPSRSGFGSTLIRAAFSGSEDTQVDYQITENAVTASFKFRAPLKTLLSTAWSQAHEPSQQPKPRFKAANASKRSRRCVPGSICTSRQWRPWRPQNTRRRYASRVGETTGAVR
ncbi:MAG: DUF4118 domain-containing protein [Hyphomonadaceae bacterium]|nr:DUF4118 domain-containing protein [Hyphomonadaceae bacterium]